MQCEESAYELRMFAPRRRLDASSLTIPVEDVCFVDITPLDMCSRNLKACMFILIHCSIHVFDVQSNPKGERKGSFFRDA